MSCKRCGATKTINAHPIPRAIATEVQVGTAHVAQVVDGSSFKITQSGLFDPDLCSKDCDGLLGAHEDYAIRCLRHIRVLAATAQLGKLEVPTVRSEGLLRFVASILWKYGQTKAEFGRIQLGPYLPTLQNVAFDNSTIPTSLDAYMIRLKRFPADDGVFAYRAPKPYKRDSIRLIRLLAGGVLFIVEVAKRRAAGVLGTEFWLNGSSTTTVLVDRAQRYEEFAIGKTLWEKNERLSAFLDKQEAV